MLTVRIPKEFIDTRISERQSQWLDPLLQSRRIRITITHLNIAFILDVEDEVLIGRKLPDGKQTLDLEPFQAMAHGVSRKHLLLSWQDNRLVAIDQNSLNNSRLNGEIMIPSFPYPIYNHDDLRLGACQLHIEFITDPDMLMP